MYREHDETGDCTFICNLINTPDSHVFSRPHCNSGFGEHPLYVNVDMKNGGTQTTWIDSLQAAFAGVQVILR